MRAKDISRIKQRKQTPTKIIPKAENFSFVQKKSNYQELKHKKQTLQRYTQLEPKKYYDCHYPQKLIQCQKTSKVNKDKDDKKKAQKDQESEYLQEDASQTLEMLKLIYIQIFGQKKYKTDYKRFQNMQNKLQNQDNYKLLPDSLTDQNENTNDFNLQGKLLFNIIEQIKRLKEQKSFQQIHKNSDSKLNYQHNQIKSLQNQNKNLKQQNQQFSQQLQLLKQQIRQLQDHKLRLTHLNQCKFKKIQELKKQLTYCSDYIDQKEVQLSQLMQENQKLQTTLKFVQQQHNKTVVVMRNLEQSVLDCKIQNQVQLEQKFKVQGFIWALQEIDNELKKIKLENIELQSMKNIQNNVKTHQNNKKAQIQNDIKVLIDLQSFQMFSSLKSHKYHQPESQNNQKEQNFLQIQKQFQHSTHFN